MPQLEWYDAVDLIRPHIVRISTPTRSGTGFLLVKGIESQLSVIATAGHVVAHAHQWEQPIRIVHAETGEEALLKEPDRAIILGTSVDTASIALRKTALPFPDEPLRLTPEGHYLRTGNDIGWLGYPSVSPTTLCFFAGGISAFLSEKNAYLVDGVVINGVSGGPAFSPDPDGKLTVVGVVTAYIPNRATGEVLPGLCIVSDVIELYAAVQSLESIEEAKKEEAVQPDALPPPKEDEASPGA